MQENLTKFRDVVIRNFSQENFVYHEWMTDYHLRIVEKIAIELCDLHPEADRDAVLALVWLHDFGKPFSVEKEREITLNEGAKAMRECGYSDSFIEKVIELWKLMEKKNEIDISTTPIETQIVSSADGASHFVGVFFPSYFNENGANFFTTQNELRAKMEKDWNRKITLPEVRNAFEKRYQQARELVGEFPDKFL